MTIRKKKKAAAKPKRKVTAKPKAVKRIARTKETKLATGSKDPRKKTLKP